MRPFSIKGIHNSIAKYLTSGLKKDCQSKAFLGEFAIIALIAAVMVGVLSVIVAVIVVVTAIIAAVIDAVDTVIFAIVL